MTTFLLIRHGQTATTGISITGWQPGHHLDATGQRQAQVLAERLGAVPIRAIYTSPLERAIETAEPTAKRHQLKSVCRTELGEIRVGDWEGMAIQELEGREDWRRFNTFRSTTRPPGGELMAE